MKNIYLLILLWLVSLSALAQPGSLDLTFRGTGAGDHIRNTVVQPDGKIIIVGDFWIYNDSSLSHIARVLNNGGVDTSFHIGTGTDRKIYALALQPDGKIIIGGDFFDYNGNALSHLARLNNNGTFDTTFNTGTGTDNSIKVLCLQPDGKILVGGSFLQYNGNTCNRIVRLNTDGSADTTFNPGTAANGTIECMAVQPDGKILVGGSFTSFNGTMDIRIARININGSIDSTFNQGFGGTNSTVAAMAFQYDSSIIIGGNFTTYNLQSLNRIARLNPDGDPNNNFFEGTAANSSVQTIKVDNNNYIYIGGSFSSYDGMPVNRLARLTPQGRLDTTFNINGTGSPGDVSTISFQPNGKIIIGGDFLFYNDTSRHRLARLYNCLTPQPDSIFGTSYAYCSGVQQIYSVSPVTDATKYQWTLPNGWSGSSDSASIIAASSGSGGPITVKAFTDSCGWSFATTRNITTVQPPGVNICLVTVDTASTHNIVIWEKPVTTTIDSFFIYRETSTNIYTKIAGVPYDSLSEYHDTAANPNATSYRYRISALDTCGAESDLSLYHNTIHLQNLGSGNFQWTFYQIENTLNPVLSFNIYRDNNSTGNFTQIGNVPGSNSTFTDVTFNSFSNSEYVVDAQWSISCTPTRSVNTTRSNIKHKNAIDALAINEQEIQNEIQVYPNPAHENLIIHFAEKTFIKQIQLINTLGQATSPLSFRRAAGGEVNIPVAQLPKGIYTLCIEAGEDKVVKKVVIE